MVQGTNWGQKDAATLQKETLEDRSTWPLERENSLWGETGR